MEHRTRLPPTRVSVSSSMPSRSSSTHYASDSISYTADGGGQVCITFPFNPWKVLGLKTTASYDAKKMAFKRKITEQERQSRASASLANHIFTSEERYQLEQGSKVLYTIKKHDHFTVAAYGNTKELRVMIRRKRSLIAEVDERGRTLLYLACKSGFYDMVKMLLQKGADINKVQQDGSTPLHVAAYYSHAGVVGLLLEHGARIDIKNRWDQTALQESATVQITNTIQNASSDLILSFANSLMKKQLISKFRPIEFKGQVIAKELIRDPRVLDPETRSGLNRILKEWEMTWHGTRFSYLESILKDGLLPAGTKGILPPTGHVNLGVTCFGIPNWAAAIFVSPSILYSAHVAYSERVVSNREQWCVLVKAYCRPGSFKKYNPTTVSERMEGEPDYPEFRIHVEGPDKEVILRVESTRNVVVRSVMFVRAKDLENKEFNFKEAVQLFRG